MPVVVRPSFESDLAAICAIYSHHVLHGTGTFETEPPDLDAMAGRRTEVLARGLPWLVAVDADHTGQVLGFAYCNWFKPRPAYRYSAEDSVYVRDEARGRGVGRQLLGALVHEAETAGVRKLLAVIGDSANAGSIALHRAAGFSEAGVLRSMGWKFGAWRDVVLMERPLGAGATAPPG